MDNVLSIVNCLEMKDAQEDMHSLCLNSMSLLHEEILVSLGVPGIPPGF